MWSSTVVEGGGDSGGVILPSLLSPLFLFSAPLSSVLPLSSLLLLCLFVITQFWVTPKFCFPFLQKMKKNEKKKLHGAVLNGTCSFFSPANAETGEKKDIFEIFPAILPFSLSTPLAQKSRMTHTHTYTTIPCNSHAIMPCTWTGYGEPLPRLPINTGERIEPVKGG